MDRCSRNFLHVAKNRSAVEILDYFLKKYPQILEVSASRASSLADVKDNFEKQFGEIVVQMNNYREMFPNFIEIVISVLETKMKEKFNVEMDSEDLDTLKHSLFLIS